VSPRAGRDACGEEITSQLPSHITDSELSFQEDLTRTVKSRTVWSMSIYKTIAMPGESQHSDNSSEWLG